MRCLDIVMEYMDIGKRAALLAMSCIVLLLMTPSANAALQQPNIVIPDTAFIEAVRDGDQEQVQAALVRGQTPDARDKVGMPALFVALHFRQMEMFRFLIDKGARIKVKDRDGDTLLTILADTKHLSLVDLLLELGADPDRFGANGEPPIIVAARAGGLEMVRLLLSYDADYDATDLTGRGALAIAEESRFSDIADLLREAGAY